MWFFWIKNNFSDNATTLYEVFNTCRIRNSMNSNDFVFFIIIRANCQKILAFCLFKLKVCYFTLKFHVYSKSFIIFFTVLLIPFPIFILQSLFETLIKEQLPFLSDFLFKFPQDYLNLISMTKCKDITN